MRCHPRSAPDLSNAHGSAVGPPLPSYPRNPSRLSRPSRRGAFRVRGCPHGACAGPAAASFFRVANGKNEPHLKITVSPAVDESNPQIKLTSLNVADLDFSPPTQPWRSLDRSRTPSSRVRSRELPGAFRLPGRPLGQSGRNDKCRSRFGLLQGHLRRQRSKRPKAPAL